MKKRVVLTFGLLLLLAVALLILSSIATAPATSAVQVSACVSTGSGDCLHFPTISGATLTGTEITIPQDFNSKLTLIIVPFDEKQQISAGRWLPFAQTLKQDFPTLTYYSVAIFTDLAPAMRAFIRAGMNLAIPDANLQAITITAFLQNRQAFLDALAIPDTDQLQVFLLNAAGDLIWRGSGEYDIKQAEQLRAAIQPGTG